MRDITDSIEACAARYGDDAAAMRRYLIEGQDRALTLENRGPIRFEPDGGLAQDIREAYSRFGFYVFTGVLESAELADLESDLAEMRSRFPVEQNSPVDAAGRPALGTDCKALTLLWSKPLGDPLGGTELANGRHEVKMFEPEAAPTAPATVPFLLLGSLQFSDACLRVYAHLSLIHI